MADFLTCYLKYVKPWEGGYGLVANDKGGETYGGIARNLNPNWPGFLILDKIKKQRTIKNGMNIPELNDMVAAFYKNWWDSEGYNAIKSQDVANLLFDYRVNSGPGHAVKDIQKIVGAKVDGALGPDTLNRINAANPNTVYSALKASRIALLNNIVKNDPTQAKFLNGWLNRVNSFPALVVGGSVAFLLIALVCVFLLIKN